MNIIVIAINVLTIILTILLSVIAIRNVYLTVVGVSNKRRHAAYYLLCLLGLLFTYGIRFLVLKTIISL